MKYKSEDECENLINDIFGDVNDRKVIACDSYPKGERKILKIGSKWFYLKDEDIQVYLLHKEDEYSAKGADDARVEDPLNGVVVLPGDTPEEKPDHQYRTEYEGEDEDYEIKDEYSGDWNEPGEVWKCFFVKCKCGSGY